MTGISGTKEWATTNENFQIGCEHDCRYCYAREMALRFKRISSVADWATPHMLRNKVERTSFPKRKGTIMFPTTHDLTPKNMHAALRYLKLMLKAGNKVLIVSKPHLACITMLTFELAEYKDQIMFRFTIGSLNDCVLKFWEPGAPDFQERFECLQHAFRTGYKTSVSAEPFLDVKVVDLVEKLSPYVTDAIWIGLMNKIEKRVDTTEWPPIMLEQLTSLKAAQDRASVRQLYEALKDNPKVKWKESMKKIVGLPVATEAGLDV